MCILNHLKFKIIYKNVQIIVRYHYYNVYKYYYYCLVSFSHPLIFFSIIVMTFKKLNIFIIVIAIPIIIFCNCQICIVYNYLSFTCNIYDGPKPIQLLSFISIGPLQIHITVIHLIASTKVLTIIVQQLTNIFPCQTKLELYYCQSFSLYRILYLCIILLRFNY